jgi:hypothetical protein
MASKPQDNKTQADSPQAPDEVFPKVLEEKVRADGSVYRKSLLADGTIVEHH